MRKRLVSLAGCLLLILGSVFAQDKAPANTYDKRWFISPLLKLQAQDFGLLEKNKKNQLSNSNNLSFTERSNYSFSASVYKNFTGRISMSLDAGFGKGHITSKDVLIENTESKSYNIVNATLFFHLLNASYRLQPFISAGISNLTNEQSYTSAPIGAGVKFSGKKIMVEAHASYGYGVSKNVANALVYNLGIYIPLKSKKDKKKEEEKKEADKKDSTGKGGNVTYITNNYYFLMGDSTKNKTEDDEATKEARRKARADLNPGNESGTDAEGKNKDNGDGSGGGEGTNAPLDPDDPMNLPAAEKSMVYFYYDSYALSSSAFSVVDQVIQRMKEDKTLNVHLKGYTDLAGSEQYNLPLSKKRAQMVFDYMNSRGISTDRIILTHYGKENPVINSVDPKSAWQNRRCEIVLFEKK